MNTRRLVTAGAAAAAITLTCAGPAAAQVDVGDLMKASLNANDLPRFARPAPAGTTTVVRDGDSLMGPELCVTRSSQLLFGREPRRRVSAIVPVTGSLPGLTIEVARSDIFEYRSRGQAAAAFREIGQSLKSHCDYDAKVDAEPMGIKLIAKVHAVVDRLPQHGGSAGWSSLFKARATSNIPNVGKSDALANRYAAYRHMGRFVVRSSWGQADALTVTRTEALTPRVRDFVRSTARAVADRLH